MFVDPLGRDIERTELNVEAVRVHEVPLTQGRTVYDRIGDVPAWTAIAALAAAVVAGGRRVR
jgi:apolipoprotein N-acyltransferase